MGQIPFCQNGGTRALHLSQDVLTLLASQSTLSIEGRGRLGIRMGFTSVVVVHGISAVTIALRSGVPRYLVRRKESETALEKENG